MDSAEYQKGFEDCLKAVKKTVKNNLMGHLEAVDIKPGMTIDTQMFKVSTEFAELVKAVEEYKRKGNKANRIHVASEGVDLQFSVETMLAILGMEQIERDDLRADIKNGNEQAGYINRNPHSIYRLYVGKDNDFEGEYESLDEMNRALESAVETDKENGLSLSYNYEEYQKVNTACAYDAECGF